MKSKTLDIIGFYSLTGSAAYKVAAVESFPLGQLIVPFQKNIFFSFFFLYNQPQLALFHWRWCMYILLQKKRGRWFRAPPFIQFVLWRNIDILCIILKGILWRFRFDLNFLKTILISRLDEQFSRDILGGRGGGGLGPKICLWNSCWSPKFCLQNCKWQIPQILPSEFQIWSQNWDFFPNLRLVVTELPKFFLLFGELGRTLPQILPPNLMWSPSLPPTSIFGSSPPWITPQLLAPEWLYEKN